MSDIFYQAGYFLRAFPRRAVFNNRMLLDLIYLDGDPVLHVVECGINFSAARFRSQADTKSIWIAFVVMWINAYTG